MFRTVRSFLRQRVSYEPIDDSSDRESLTGNGESRPPGNRVEDGGFSWVEYAIFVLLGIAMLWAWNMFLAAAPYFERRFDSNKSILARFQATEVSVSTLANLGTMMILTKLQANASYPRRIKFSLILLITTFALLSISTKAFRAVSAKGYFAFFIVMVLASSIAVGFIQNGIFAYVSGFGRKEYVQGIMTGQAIAGVLPPVVQIITVLSAGGDDAGQESSTSAMAYFLTATGVSAIALLAFVYLSGTPRRRKVHTVINGTIPEDYDASESAAHVAEQHDAFPKKSIPLLYLARRLRYSSAAVFLTFGITMVFPVFTSAITSTHPDPPLFLRKASFIPLAFLIWNIGDLLGRLVTAVPRLSLASRPRMLLVLAVMRIVFIPLYLLCNLHHPSDINAGATPSSPGLPVTVKSDAFYLLVVQLPFGLTNGYLGSCCMMGANEQVEDEAREAAGGFMAMMLVAGLAAGSLCSFAVSR